MLVIICKCCLYLFVS